MFGIADDILGAGYDKNGAGCDRILCIVPLDIEKGEPKAY